jgi:hypothetical protein
MQPSDSPAASTRLQSSLDVSYPGANVGSVRRDRSHHEAGRRIARYRRRVGEDHRVSVARIFTMDVQGSPRLPGHPLRPCRSQPPRRPPFDSPYRLREYCFPENRILEHRDVNHFGAASSYGPPVRPTTHQPRPHGRGCKPGYQPAGYALAAWGLHPQDDSSEFQSTSSTSSPTGIAWSLPVHGFRASVHGHGSGHGHGYGYGYGPAPESDTPSYSLPCSRHPVPTLRVRPQSNRGTAKGDDQWTFCCGI